MNNKEFQKKVAKILNMILSDLGDELWGSTIQEIKRLRRELSEER